MTKLHHEASQTFNSWMYPLFLVATIQNSGVDVFPRKKMGVKWSLNKISNCETRKSRKWCRWEDASNFSYCPGLKRRNRVVSVYVAPACQASCQPPPKPSSSRRGRRLQRRRWRATWEEVKMGTTRSARWGEGGSWAKMALPAPPCPAPATAQRCLGPIRK